MIEFRKMFCSKCGSEINVMGANACLKDEDIERTKRDTFGKLIVEFQEGDRVKEHKQVDYLNKDYVSLHILQEMNVNEKEFSTLSEETRISIKVKGVIDKFYQKYNIPKEVKIYSRHSIFLHMEACLSGYIDVEDIKYGRAAKGGAYAGNEYIEGYTLVKRENYNSYINSFEPFFVGYNCKERCCPLCGGKLFWSRYKPLEEAEKEVLNTLQYFDNEDVSEFNFDINISKVEAHKFIKNLVMVENNIKFFKKRLFDLFYNRFLVEMDFMRENIYKKKYKDEIAVIKNKLKEIELEMLDQKEGIETSIDEIVHKYGIVRPKNIPCPQEPKIIKPETPVFEKETLFNKKKIREINNQRKADYDFKMREYESIWEKYKVEYDEYLKDREYISILNGCRQKENDRKLDIKNKKNELEQTLEMLETKVITLEKNSCEQIIVILDKEIDEIKTMISKFMHIRKKMHCSNFIFGKYLDYVSITTLLEYFESGRCSELKGPEGAYNLYESELKQSLIIDKLDDIIKSLDDIKQSQYLLYSAIKDVEKSVKYLSDETTKIVEVLKNIEKNTTSINMNTAYIAYNTARTAEYAKRNAELTDAMGYLIALG